MMIIMIIIIVMIIIPPATQVNLISACMGNEGISTKISCILFSLTSKEKKSHVPRMLQCMVLNITKCINTFM